MSNFKLEAVQIELCKIVKRIESFEENYNRHLMIFHPDTKPEVKEEKESELEKLLSRMFDHAEHYKNPDNSIGLCAEEIRELALKKVTKVWERSLFATNNCQEVKKALEEM